MVSIFSLVEALVASNWPRVTPAARMRAQAAKAVGRRKRYRYMRDVIGAESWKCREGQHSVIAMMSFFPGHEFPPELVAIGKPGRKVGVKT